MKWIVLLLFPCLAFANYLSIGESGEVMPPNTYRIGGSLQSMSGLNAGGFLDVGWRDDLSSRFLFGVGYVEFQMGATLKYIPFPDIGKQPALGIRSAFWLARIGDTSVTTWQIAPMASKKIDLNGRGQLTGYVAIPINFTFFRNQNEVGTQFTVGSEYVHPDLHEVFFAGEIVLNMSKSESALNFFVSIPFDNKSGFKKRDQ